MELKPCPFCGGRIKTIEFAMTTLNVYTKAECMGCNMVFEYDQDFTFVRSKATKETIKVAVNESFETVWNRRAEDG